MLALRDSCSSENCTFIQASTFGFSHAVAVFLTLLLGCNACSFCSSRQSICNHPMLHGTEACTVNLYQGLINLIHTTGRVIILLRLFLGLFKICNNNSG